MSSSSYNVLAMQPCHILTSLNRYCVKSGALDSGVVGDTYQDYRKIKMLVMRCQRRRL